MARPKKVVTGTLEEGLAPLRAHLTSQDVPDTVFQAAMQHIRTTYPTLVK